MPNERTTPLLLAVAWALILLSGLVLIISYPSLPGEVILYRSPWGSARGAKSWLTVGRIVFMGMGQLGAATAFVLIARSSAFWRTFWRSLAVVAGIKTLLECLAMTAPPGSVADQAFFVSTLLLVGFFVLGAARWGRRGFREPHPPLRPAGQLAVLASLTLWFVFALAPKFIR
jgi:hypothetical protein